MKIKTSFNKQNSTKKYKKYNFLEIKKQKFINNKKI